MDILKRHIRATKADIRLCECYPKLFCNAVLNELEKELLASQRKLYNRIHKRYGFLFNRSAWWVGVHYSPFNKRYCINLLPCVTIWFCCKGGKVPQKGKL